MGELTACGQYIVQQLSAQPALSGISAWSEQVPEAAAGQAAQGQIVAFPCVLFSLLSGRDTVGAGGGRLLTRPIYLIRAVGVGDSFAALQPLADAIDAALQGNSVNPPVTVGGMTVRGAVRESARQYSDDDAGVRYNHLGGEYQFFVYGPS